LLKKERSKQKPRPRLKLRKKRLRKLSRLSQVSKLLPTSISSKPKRRLTRKLLPRKPLWLRLLLILLKRLPKRPLPPRLMLPSSQVTPSQKFTLLTFQSQLSTVDTLLFK